MFAKLKNLSEDVAKSLNQDPQRRSVTPVNELKNEAKVLKTVTPDPKDLVQPEDEAPTQDTKEVESSKELEPADPTEPSQPGSSSKVDVDLSTLPPGIRSKMKKFAKYEEKYPVLLDAYKTEKRKGELIMAFEKVLQENTPISSISDADVLVDYLRGLNEKSELANKELRRKTTENSQLTRHNKQHVTKLEKYEQKIKELEEKNGELTKQLASEAEKPELVGTEKDTSPQEGVGGSVTIAGLEKELAEAKGKLKDLETGANNVDGAQLEVQMKEQKELVSDLQSKIVKLETEKADLESKNTKLEKENSDFQSKNAKLEQEKSDLGSTYSKLEESMNSKDSQLTQTAENVVNLQSNIKTLETETQSLKEKLQSFETRDKEANETDRDTNGSSLTASKKKKKNKKKKNTETINEVEKSRDAQDEGDDKFESMYNSTLAEYTELQTKYDTLVKENEELLKNNRANKSALDEKNEEIENLRDLLRDLGDNLVEAKDRIKLLQETNNQENQEEMKKLTDEKESIQRQLLAKDEELNKVIQEQLSKEEKFQKQIGDNLKVIETKKLLQDEFNVLLKKHAELNKQFETGKKEIASLKGEKEGLNSRIAELAQFRSNDSSLKLEIASIQTSLTHKSQLIEEYKQKIDELSKVKDELNETISQLKISNNEMSNSNKALVKEKSDLVTKHELSIERASSLNAELLKLQAERQKVADELASLQMKYDSVIEDRADSKTEVQSFKQQYDELLMKSKESSMKIDNLEDELTEARNMLQERSRESSTIRRLLMEAEEQVQVKNSEFKIELTKIGEEKNEIEANCQMLLKKKQRDIDEFKSINENYLSKIGDLESKLEELKTKYEALEQKSVQQNGKSAGEESFEDVQETLQTLRSSLQVSAKKVKDFEHLNGVLKKLNEESGLKFERLSKNYKLLTQQYRQMKANMIESSETPNTTSPLASSRPSLDGNEASANNPTNIAYLKNVLLGFFEHKEQREQLLPVVKTLFDLDADDEQKFLHALK